MLWPYSFVSGEFLKRRTGALVDREGGAAGFSAAELLVLLGILSIVTLAGGAAWTNIRTKTEIDSAARVTKTVLSRARMLSVYRNENHFVVLDRTDRRIEIYRDSRVPKGRFDAGDERVASEILPAVSALELPTPAPLASPLGGPALAQAWSLPIPEPGGAWGERLGVMTNSAGMILSAVADPQPITAGVLVFSDRTGRSSSVAVRGQMGAVRAFHLLPSGWKEL